MLKKALSFLNYASQVRLFILLLLLFLVIIILGTTYLYGQTKLRLEMELKDRLSLMASMAAEEIKKDSLKGESSPLKPSLEAQTNLEGLVLKGRLQRILIARREGEILEFSPPGAPRLIPRGERGGLELEGATSVWEGQTIFSEFYRDRSGRSLRAIYLPLLDKKGGVDALVIAEAPAGFLGYLERFRWPIFLVYASGIVMAFVLGLLFVRSILRPYDHLTSTARTVQKLDPTVAVPEGTTDLDFVAVTFEKLIATLQEKEAELTRLYAAQQRRTQDMESYQEYILGSISSGVISFKPDLTIVVFNKTAQRIFGYKEEGVLGKSCMEVFGEEGDITRLAQEALKGQRIHSRLELSHKRRDGTPLWIGLSSSLLRDEEGNIFGLTFLLTDLTEILLLREQVMLKESLATLGQMSAGIAHEFRNSLGAILGFAKLLQKKLSLDDPKSTHVQDILAEIRAMEATLRDFLAFAKPAQLQLAEVDLTALLGECLEIYRQDLEGAGVRIYLDVPHDGPVLQADSLILKQALVNLIRNAAEAMHGGGTLRVSARLRGPGFRYYGETEGAHERESIEQELPGSFIEIFVQDTGPGISEEDLGRIFTPFFTTKDKGTGLGLAMVQKAVISHGGRVLVESQLGKGSTFRILLPYGERRRLPRI